MSRHYKDGNHPNRSTQRFTVQSIREIVKESGLEHARFCAEQEATQRGKDNMRDVFSELDRLENELYQ